MWKELLVLYFSFLALCAVLFILISLITFQPGWLLNSLFWVRGWQIVSCIYLFCLVLCGPMLIAMWAEEREKKDQS